MEFLDDLKITSYIKAGYFGLVVKAEIVSSSQDIACKLVYHVDEESRKQTIKRECENLMDKDHPNVLKTHGYSEHSVTMTDLAGILDNLKATDIETHMWKTKCEYIARNSQTLTLFLIRMELCGASLRDWLKSNPSPNSSKQIKIVNELASGLQYLHNLDIVHRDFKPENVLFSIEADNGVYGHPVKIGDFGLSREITGDESTLTSRKGTIDYMAPEAFRNLYGKQVDIFSFGLVTWEVLQLISPEDRPGHFKKLKEGETNIVTVDLIPRFNIRRAKELIIHMTKELAAERTKIIDDFIQRFTIVARNSSELVDVLANSDSGDIIHLVGTRYDGNFVLDNNDIVLDGGGVAVLSPGLSNNTDWCSLTINGNKCIVRNIKINCWHAKAEGPITNAIKSQGLLVHGKGNRIDQVTVLGGNKSVIIRGHANCLTHLHIKEADTGIMVEGNENSLAEATFIGITKTGLELNGCSNKVRDLEFLNDVDLAVELNGSGNLLENVRISSSKKCRGISHRRGANNAIANFKFKGDEEWGVDMARDTQLCSLTNVKCKVLRVSGSNHVLTSCTVEEMHVREGNNQKFTNCRANLITVSSISADDKLEFIGCTFGKPSQSVVWMQNA
ncbi:uncharacterized protein LOC118434527 [Folsomia candida]|uniref:uncharacterized protein LOC118434527 n=1 Tax=Folsomia candida TaxID=158441 RepID=UPI0016055D1B|nr:uncharacterized protein LOC118434527 [Folsomia candida]